MDLDKLSQGEKIAGGAGIALLIIMFLPWYGSGPFSVNAWESFTYTDLICFLAGVAGLALAVTAASDSDLGLPVALSSVVAGLGALATLLVLYRIIDPPGAGGVDVGREIGIFLGLIAAAAIAYGGYLGMQGEATGARR
ncbi:MAG: hypothetical protein ACXWDQ_04960 [Solirubrobacterales bacterium]